ncbi:hypothetical protein WJX72_010230 [[Myrmecia] bisecta]|uniref:RCC1-like domain-containing protein n=1 Tax=[Myrmecia] bisecta TaxID=41462 RepID=A0AAW1QGD0_9CHLO
MHLSTAGSYLFSILHFLRDTVGLGKSNSQALAGTITLPYRPAPERVGNAQLQQDSSRMAPKRRASTAVQPSEPPKSRRKTLGGSKTSGGSKASGGSKDATEKQPSKRRKVVAEEPQEEVQPVTHPSHLKVAGEMFMMGDGDCGQLGKGEDFMEAPRPTPSAIEGKQVVQVAAGGMHTVALADSGEVYTTGVNDEGALGRETAGELWETSGAAQGKPTDSYTWGRVQMPTAHGPVVQVSAGDSHTAALTNQGYVYAWGTYRDSSGVYGFTPDTKIAVLPTLVYSPVTPADRIVKIASGADHVVALTEGGQLYSWGTGQQGALGRVGPRLAEHTAKATLLQPHPVPFFKHHRGVSAKHTIVDFSCGTYGTFALTADGHVFAWGLNNYGQLALPGQEPIWTPALVKALEGRDIVGIRCGQHHTLALTKDGRLLAFGRPTYGRLGRQAANVSSDEAVPEPAPVDGLDGVKVAGMAAGLAVSGCVSEAGDAYCWGFGDSHQLGKGDDDADEVVPRRIAETKRFSNRRVLQLEFGGQHAVLLTVARDAAPAAPAAQQAKRAKKASGSAAPAALLAAPNGGAALADAPSSAGAHAEEAEQPAAGAGADATRAEDASEQPVADQNGAGSAGGEGEAEAENEAEQGVGDDNKP